MKPCEPKHYPPSVLSPRVAQIKEWFGDALLTLYARQFCIWKHQNSKSFKELNILISGLVTNEALNRFATLKRINGGADMVEVMLYEKFEQDPKAARDFAYEIFLTVERA